MGQEWIGFCVCVIFAGGLIAFVLKLWASYRDPRTRDPDVCENCGYDLRETLERCPECGLINKAYARYVALRRLREEWPEDTVPVRTPGPAEELVDVYETDDGMLGRLLEQQLNERGIPCDLVTVPAIGAASRQTFSRFKQIRVWSGDAGRAREIMSWLLEEVPGERDRIWGAPDQEKRLKENYESTSN